MSAPKPLKLDRNEPRMFIQKVGYRWRSWVEVGCMRLEGEYGTYSRTRDRAEMKARRLLAHYEDRPDPAIEVSR